MNGCFTVKLIHFSHARGISSKDVVATPSEVHLEYNGQCIFPKEKLWYDIELVL